MLQPNIKEDFFDSDLDDPFFSEQAKEKYLNNSNTSDQNTNDQINISTQMEPVQWSIPDSESGAYLNTLEARLQQLKNGRTFGKSRFFGHSLNPSSLSKKSGNRVIGATNNMALSESSNCKCNEVFGEEDEEQNQDNSEVVGGKPLLANSEGGYLEDALIESYEGEQEFVDLQLQEMEHAEWTIEYSVNEENSQGLSNNTKRFYDLTTGELILGDNSTEKGEVQELQNNEESDEEEEVEEDGEDDIYDAMEGMELKDEDELNDEEDDHFITSSAENSFSSSQTPKSKTPLQNEDDWEADFPEEN
ncbi:hypothetical protein C9374_002255 [Naegleria lovaniensis]|uniref:Uncharacterized protein n=1 Tax=Naegleria lovaniensis TaxID=51637 RepID=A0AA88GVB3_NAELO|nr:uncharacterized protein C9374_002255 [Naegleria lovaniensis]KAG2386511.1 hypothetical protein C9374_002255 [Naegleria lovaniensis]